MGLAIDLYCGLGGWTDGLLAEGYDVIGFDNERHVYGDMRYPAQLVVQDVRTLHGRQFKDADLIVASPPCTEFSYLSMPWVRGKRIAAALRGEGDSTRYTYPDGRVLEFDDGGFPSGYQGSRTIAEMTALFDACFRIQREACEAAGRHVPMVVENVVGAQAWVGRARWHYGSYYLWGDVPALMPIVRRAQKVPGNPDGRNDPRDNPPHTPHMTNQNEHGIKQHKSGRAWFADPDSISGSTGSRSTKRKVASAMIAKIPFELARHIARVYAP